MYLSPCSPETNTTLFANQLYPNPQWPSSKDPPAMQEMQEAWVQSLGQEVQRRRAWLQYSCLENPMDRGTRQATVCRVTMSWTRLKQVSTHVPQYKIKSFLKNPNVLQNQSPFTKKFYLWS